MGVSNRTENGAPILPEYSLDGVGSWIRESNWMMRIGRSISWAPKCPETLDARENVLPYTGRAQFGSGLRLTGYAGGMLSFIQYSRYMWNCVFENILVK